MPENSHRDELQKLREQLYERDEYIRSLRHDIQKLERSLTWKIVSAWQRFIDKALPKGWFLRRGYDNTIFGLQKFFNDTLPAFLFRRMRDKASASTAQAFWKKFEEKYGGVEILFINHEESRTGAPKILFSVAEHFKKLEKKIAMVSLAKSTMHEEFVSAFDPIVYPADLYPYETAYSHAQKVIEYIKPKVVYANSITSFEYAQTAKRMGIKTIFHVHELKIAFENCLGSTQRAIFRECADIFIVPSPLVRDYLVIELHCDKEKVIHIPEFIDVEKVRELAKEKSIEDVRSELDIAPNHKLVLALGSFNYRKGADIFVAMAKQLTEQNFPAKFVWIGNKVIKDPFVVDFASNSQYFTFLHEKVNPFPYLAAADVLALPSREDPFPLVALEAITLGIPIVTFADNGGVHEVISGNGVTVSPLGDVVQFTNAVQKILSQVKTSNRSENNIFDSKNNLAKIESLIL